jgi:hypothetical protein
MLMLSLAASGGVCSAQGLLDNFSDRQLTETATGQVVGENTLATIEPGEPRHAGKTGGHSLWLSWVAPTNGIVTIDTSGSSLDTILAVYTLNSGTNQESVSSLLPIVSNDDDRGLKSSLVQFGVAAGIRYDIAVDGYQGAVGGIVLSWNLMQLTEIPPLTVAIPGDSSVRSGDPLLLAPGLMASGPVTAQWYLNDQPLAGAQDIALFIPNFQEPYVGRYALCLTAGGVSYFNQPVEVQINSEGLSRVIARDKLLDALDSQLDDQVETDGNLIGSPGLLSATDNMPSAIGVVRGYNGTQIFNTAYGTVDPFEPPHCNVVGGASYWFGYDAPTRGIAQLNTEGSNFPTVLAVYTYVPPLLDYLGLIPVACDCGGSTNGLASSVQFSADPFRNYLVVVDGVNGASGIAHLNYGLTPVAATNRVFLLLQPIPPHPAPSPLKSAGDYQAR